MFVWDAIYRPIIDELNKMKITYDQFELIVPQCFRNERQSFLTDMDDKIEEINNRIEDDDDGNNLMTETQKESVKMEDNIKTSSASQNISQESSQSYDLEQLLSNAQPTSTFDKIIIPDDSRELAIKLIQKHIRAMNDRIAVNQCTYIIEYVHCVYIYVAVRARNQFFENWLNPGLTLQYTVTATETEVFK